MLRGVLDIIKFNAKAKDFIKKSFASFIGSFVRVIKAIAKGAAAALAAIAPGGKTPQGEFSRVYNEVMEGGSGTIKVEKTGETGTDGEPELTEEKVAKAVKTGDIEVTEDNRPLLEKIRAINFRDDEDFSGMDSDFYVPTSKKLKKQLTIKEHNLAAAQSLPGNNFPYQQVTMDNSNKVINRTEVI